jgi:hypothetical protein
MVVINVRHNAIGKKFPLKFSIRIHKYKIIL